MFPFKRVHIVGIGGSGMNGLANILLQSGIVVTGSDRQKNDPVRFLIDKGVKFFDDEDMKPLEQAQLVVATSAASSNHPVLVKAAESKIPVWTRHQLLPALLQDRYVIAVSGSHGKTTTSSIIKHILQTSGIDCGFLIGVPNPDKGGHFGSHRAFVIEADEYARTFLHIPADLAIINNVERDHPDIYPTDEDYNQAFKQFAVQITNGGGKIITNQDDKSSQATVQGLQNFGFGFDSSSYTKIDFVEQKEVGISLELNVNGRAVKLKCPIHGKHNAYNIAAAVTAVCLSGLVDIDQIRQALLTFGTVPRRCEFKGVGKQHCNILIDDYAHAPSEVAATINALKAAYPDRKVTAIWQPHTFTRVKSFENDFVQACKTADNLIITPIYGARETGEYDFAPFKAELNPDTTYYARDKQDILYRLMGTVGEKNLVVMLNAGDLNQMSGQILAVI